MSCVLSDKRGFGLIEVMVATGILCFAILATIFSILSLQNLGELSKEKVAAVTDANRVLEAMRDTANTSLDNVRSTNWTDWAATNVVTPKGTNDIRLDQENVVAVVGGGNPAPVTLILNWNHRQRPYAYTTMTLMTDRN